MTFNHNGESVTFRGISKPPLKVVDQGKILKEAMRRRQGVLLQLSAINPDPKMGIKPKKLGTIDVNREQQGDLDSLFKDNADIFEKPKCLPPSHTHDYNIPLVERLALVVIRPYPYTPLQKSEIHKQVEEML